MTWNKSTTSAWKERDRNRSCPHTSVTCRTRDRAGQCQEVQGALFCVCSCRSPVALLDQGHAANQLFFS